MTTARNYGRRARRTRWSRMIAAALMAFCLGSALSACGKRGDPEPPPGAKEGDYPRQYPDPNSY